MIESRRMIWEEHVTRMREKRNGQFIGRNPDGKSPLGRTRRRWVDNIRMDPG
jgi:hypothetical protein